MITNLVFKRYNTSVNPPRTELKIVQVNIPELNNGEGWKLETSGEVILEGPATNRVVGFTKKVVPKLVVPTSAIEEKKPTESVAIGVGNEPKWTEVNPGEKFESGVAGTAKLIRRKDKIWIAYRNKTKDTTGPNSIAISDTTKNQFFKSAKENNGGTNFYGFLEEEPAYKYWNTFMDEEYERQRKAVNARRKAQALAAMGLEQP